MGCYFERVSRYAPSPHGWRRDAAFDAVEAHLEFGGELFAVLGGSNAALLSELAPTVVFVGVSVLGFRTSLWWVVAGLIGHGLYDIIHPAIFMNPGVPVWWPMFCMAYDVAAGAFLAWRLLRGRGPQARFA